MEEVNEQQATGSKGSWIDVPDSVKADIVRVFVGAYSNLPNIAILTPISLIRDTFLEFSLTVARSSGWWQSAHCRVGEVEFLLVEVPQGAAVIDPVLAIATFASKLLFVGYCGGIADNLSIGDTVFSLGVCHEDELEPCSWPLLIEAEQGLTGHAQALLLEDDAFLAAMHARSAIAVDMETFHIYRYARRYGAAAAALYVVSDLPARLPFFRLDRSDLTRLHHGLRKTVNNVIVSLVADM